MTDLGAVFSNLDGKLSFTEGHSIAIHQGLNLKNNAGAGKARINPDVTMTSLIRMDVLSMSKTITAAGVVRQLLASGLTPAHGIRPFLPASWNVNAQIAQLTFAHVMTHSGGLLGDQSDFGQLKALCESPPAGTFGVVDYQNINYSLLRVLLAYLSCPLSLGWLEARAQTLLPTVLAQTVLPTVTATMYADNIQRNIMAPAGIGHASIGPESPTNLQAEWFADAHDHLGDQHLSTNPILVCGADHWNMDVRDYGRFIAHLINGSFSPDPWPTMRDTRAPGAASALPAYPTGDARLGVWRFQAPDGTGNFYGHNGDWSDAFTGWMAFNGGINVTFFANSTLGPTEQERMILDSWLAA